jgi:hypothetical protein
MPTDAKHPARGRPAHDNPLLRMQELPAQALDRLPVMKKIGPNRPGAKSWQRQHGELFVCLRYRDDAEQARRYVTIEILVDQRPIKPKASSASTRVQKTMPAAPPTPQHAPTVEATLNGSPTELVQVRIRYAENQLREKAKMAGALWDRDLRNWVMTRQQAQDAGLQDRVKAKKPTKKSAY